MIIELYKKLKPSNDPEQDKEPLYITQAKAAGLEKLLKYAAIIQSKSVYAKSLALDPRFKLRAFRKDPDYPFKRDIDQARIMALWEAKKPKKTLAAHHMSGILARPSYLADDSVDEMENFLNSAIIDKERINAKDHVTYWIANKMAQPSVFELVQENYSAAVTSVATERLFSWARYMLPYTRNSTHTDNVRKSILLKSWTTFFDAVKIPDADN